MQAEQEFNSTSNESKMTLAGSHKLELDKDFIRDNLR